MRALFTQLSFLVGLLTAINLSASQPGLPVAILLGVSAGCTIYIVLLLGDFVIHKWLEENASELTSVRFIDETFEPVENPESSFEEPEIIAA